MCRDVLLTAAGLQIYSLSTLMTDQSILSDFLSVILVVRGTEGGGVHKQMLPTDLRKHGGGARCSDDLTTLGPADMAVMEIGTGRRN